jgi:hypothetical protein
VDQAATVGGNARGRLTTTRSQKRRGKETGQFAEDAKAAGRQIANGVRRLGKKIKEAVGAD